jgi:hypothetical protein
MLVIHSADRLTLAAKSREAALSGATVVALSPRELERGSYCQPLAVRRMVLKRDLVLGLTDR